ncbi:hypothetical protein [Streptomyces sp. NBC_00009]|uniref:hypothetical protein n=1 Tax=Streptomyces sp. NBC_00009 TaxID=2975620 RepID=UPI003252E8A4
MTASAAGRLLSEDPDSLFLLPASCFLLPASCFLPDSHEGVIAIDEVDRLGSDTQVLAFLVELKAILGVSHVHHLISVAAEVSAAFGRRGLPHSNAADSSLDDVVHVPSSSGPNSPPN